MYRKTLGILGGMGPESTAALYLRIVRATPITREQDHLRTIIDSNPAIPDRTEALRSGAKALTTNNSDPLSPSRGGEG